METLLSSPAYDFLNTNHKTFVVAFDAAMADAGYVNAGIQPYVTFGKFKIEYWNPAPKSKKVVARIYFRDDGIVLRLYFTNIDKHRSYIENAPSYIQDAFTNNHANCKHCDNGFNKNGTCKFRKSYTLHGIPYQKCSGDSFYFTKLDLSCVSGYLQLLATFYPAKA